MRHATILLARHGETAWNRDGNRYCGSTEVALSPAGERQAELLVNALREVPLAAIYASSAGRAQATAAPTARRHGLPVGVEPDLRETDFGLFEGHTAEELHTTHPQEFAAWRADPERTAPPGGELATEAVQRALQALDRIARRHQGQTVLVVAHNTLNRLILCRLLDAPLRSYRRIMQQNTGINTIEWGDEIRVAAVNETGHLRG